MGHRPLQSQWAMGHSDPVQLKEKARDVERLSPTDLNDRRLAIKQLTDELKTPSNTQLMQIAIDDLKNHDFTSAAVGLITIGIGFVFVSVVIVSDSDLESVEQVVMFRSGVSSDAAEKEEAGEALYSGGVPGIWICSADAVDDRLEIGDRVRAQANYSVIIGETCRAPSRRAHQNQKAEQLCASGSGTT
ncbi:hypothetical protein TB2_004456 [Malus domestica]